MNSTTRALMTANLSDVRKTVPLLAPLREDVASIGPKWLPVALVLGAIAAVAYVDHRVVSISLVYLYIFPLGISAILLRKELTYSLVPVSVLVHDYWSPRVIHPEIRIFDNLVALLC